MIIQTKFKFFFEFVTATRLKFQQNIHSNMIPNPISIKWLVLKDSCIPISPDMAHSCSNRSSCFYNLAKVPFSFGLLAKQTYFSSLSGNKNTNSQDNEANPTMNSTMNPSMNPSVSIDNSSQGTKGMFSLHRSQRHLCSV